MRRSSAVLFLLAFDHVFCFQPVPFLPRNHAHGQRGQPLNVFGPELTLLSFDFGDAIVTAVGAAGLLVAASIITKEVAVVREQPLLKASNKMLPSPPKEKPPLQLLNLVEVQKEQATAVLEAPKIVKKVSEAVVKEEAVPDLKPVEPIDEEEPLSPDAITGVPYVSDSLVDVVEDELGIYEEENSLIVDPLVLDEDLVLDEEDESLVLDEEDERDAILDNPLLYEGGYFEEEQEALLGTYERRVVEEELVGTYEPVNVEKLEPVVNYLDSLVRVDEAEPTVSYLDSLSADAKAEPTYLEGLAASQSMSADAKAGSYLEGLAVSQLYERIEEDEDSIVGVPYVSDSLVDAVQDGLEVIEDEGRLTVDPLALSRMEEDDCFVELYEKAENIVAQYEETEIAVAEETQVVDKVMKEEEIVEETETDVAEETQVVDKVMKEEEIVEEIETAVAEETQVVDEVMKEEEIVSPQVVDDIPAVADVVAASIDLEKPSTAEPIVEEPLDEIATGDRSVKEMADLLFSLQEPEEVQPPRPKLKLSKSPPKQEAPTMQEPLVPQRKPSRDPKLDEVIQQLQDEAIEKTKERLRKAEQPVEPIKQAPSKPVEEGTKRTFSVEKERPVEPKAPVEEGTKRAFSVEKEEKQKATKPAVKSLEMKDKEKGPGVLGVLRERKLVIGVATVAVVVVRRVIVSILGRGML